MGFNETKTDAAKPNKPRPKRKDINIMRTIPHDYYNLLTSGKMNSHLAEIDKQAEKF